MDSMRKLRYNRTRANTRVLSLMRWMLSNEATLTDPNGLPSWWPFWSDCLRQDVRELYRAGMLLRAAERTQADG